MTRCLVFVVCFVMCRVLVAAEPAPGKPVLWVVHAGWCAPCRLFARAWEDDEEFRDALMDCYSVRSLDWDKPNERAFAIGLGINNPATGRPSLPTFVGVRFDSRRQISFGFAVSGAAAEIERAKADLLVELGVQWPRQRALEGEQKRLGPRAAESGSASAPDPVPEAAAVDSVARDSLAKLLAQNRELSKSQAAARESIGRLSSEVGGVRDAFESSRESLEKKIDSSRVDVNSISSSVRESVERLIVERVGGAAPAAGGVGSAGVESPAGGISSKWLAVAGFAAKVGIAVAAPEVALPLSGGLTVAGLALSWIRRRRAARRPGVLGSAANPISVLDHGQVRTDTKFVVTETDVLGEAYAEAVRRCANQHREANPGAVDLLQQLDGVARQLAHGQRIVRRPKTSSASETLP